MTPKLLWSVALAALSLTASAFDTSTPAATQTALAVLRERIIRFVGDDARSHYPQARVDVTFELPVALQPPCREPTIASAGVSGAQRSSVRLRCADVSWSAFVPVAGAVSVPVLKTTSALRRGDAISMAQLTTQFVALDRLRANFVDPAAEFGDWQVKQSIPTGRVLYSRQLEPAQLVRKGDRVRISAGTPTARIVTLGEATTAGAHGDQVSVRNLASGRLIRAWVVGRGSVAVRLPLPGDATQITQID